MHTSTEHFAITATRHWVEQMVVGLNMCPFARAEHVNQRIRYVLCAATDEDAVLQLLAEELRFLSAADPAQTETTLIICPQAFADFVDFHFFQNAANALLKKLKLRGELQIASFHPAYVFAGSSDDDLGNYSNRSPYPTLHLLRESSIARAVESMDTPDSIYENNIRLLRQMGRAAIEQRMLGKGVENP